MARLITVDRPEAAGVRSEHFVGDDDVALFIETELELGVGDDDALGTGVVRALVVQREGAVSQLLRILFALARELLLEDFDGLFIGDVLVMVTDLRLGGRGVDGFRQLVGLLQALRQFDAADGAVLAVALPAGTGDVTTDDGFDGKHGEFLAEHAVSVELRLTEVLRHVVHIDADHMVRKDVFRQIEPEFGHLGQDGTLLRDFVLEDDIERGDAVGGNEDQCIAQVIDLADFSFFDGFILLHGEDLLNGVEIS